MANQPTPGRRLVVTLASHRALDETMKFRSMSNRKLADKVDVSAATIAHLRRGARKHCAPELAPRIEGALDVTPGSLFVGEVIDDWTVSDVITDPAVRCQFNQAATDWRTAYDRAQANDVWQEAEQDAYDAWTALCDEHDKCYEDGCWVTGSPRAYCPEHDEDADDE